MNPATAAALTTALVWSSILDAMLVRTHADSICRSRLEFQRNKERNQTFGLIANMTDELYHLWYSIRIVRMSMGGLYSLLRNL